jgi:hypothetical protein
MPAALPATIQAFITKWQLSGAAERANAQMFLGELCEIIGVEPPQPKGADEAANAYVYEKVIPAVVARPAGAMAGATLGVDHVAQAKMTSNFIDLYKRGCFVLETKQGADAVQADDAAPVSLLGELSRKHRKSGHGIRGTMGYYSAMEKAREQAQRYARALPKEEIADGRPPFVIVVDVGHSISLYTDWTRMGAEYVPFPDPASFRFLLKDLLREEVREMLRTIWTEPLALDPGRRSAKVTREIADRLARLARSLEGKHEPEHVANFLMRCLFTMFSEDVDLLPHGSFTRLLGELKNEPENFAPMLENLWGTMNTGGLSPILRKKLPRFNGGLFAHAGAIALDADQIQLLIEAATANWRDVEPAIFGTLLERALDPRERHKLGAHYTPRAYVERLVNPTVIDPLREQWKSVQVAALQLAEEGQEKKAIKEVEAFLHQLASTRVLDPACGSGNFLYVTLELLKRLEGEVLNTLHELGATAKLELEGVMVTPANFLGIELNPRAAAIAEQVLWIGFLQWHLRTHGNLQNLPEPIIKDLHNIECRDAVLEWDRVSPLLDKEGRPVTRWDGRTTKPHPVTGEEVPDPHARVEALHYHNPRPAQWPKCDYIVGNPPFIGTSRMREALGDGYTESLRKAYDNVPDSADFVMFWWDKAAELTRNGKVKRFGFITTNSLRQTFNRRVLQHHMAQKKPISLAFAIPDHPWVDTVDGAAVRVAMTIGLKGESKGQLQRVISESNPKGDDAAEVQLHHAHGKIFQDLTIGADVGGAIQLRANDGIAIKGFELGSQGFLLDKETACRWLAQDPDFAKVLQPYMNGKDLVSGASHRYVIDFHGYNESESQAFKQVYQQIIDNVLPERQVNREARTAAKWWLFRRSGEKARLALKGLPQFIATTRTSKHRLFQLLPKEVVAESKIVIVALDDPFYLGVLSSSIHQEWALASGGWLGVGNDPTYNHEDCFNKFPFPAATEEQKARIRELAEQLDAHRKRQQALHPKLTMTEMYNVLEAVRAGTSLITKEKKIYDEGLVGILKQLHDELDAAVAEAYGWSDLFPPASSGVERGGLDPESRKAEILTRLVALNAERAAEESNGLVRWLRPEYQAPQSATSTGEQTTLDVEEEEAVTAVQSAGVTPSGVEGWPKELPAQAAALSSVLQSLTGPTDVATIAACFEGKASKKRLEEIARLLETLEALGRAKGVDGGWVGV